MKIILGDLRHKTVGLHSVYIPLGIGFIGSYTLSQFQKGLIDVKLFTDPDEIINEIEQWKPHLVGVSNYLWNSNVSYRICEITKEIDPEIITVSGGPQFPALNNERKEYLYKRPDIDFYIYGDGEVAFARLIKKLIGFGINRNKIRAVKNDGVVTLKPNTKEILIGDPVERFTNMDEIPSPYLTGLFDKFLSANYMPALETTRGCPYTCAYCHSGNPNKIGAFSVERIKDELDYIVEHADDVENKGLSLFDDNFGLFKKDDEIAGYLAYLKNKTGWPVIIEGAGTVKKGGDVFIPGYEILKSENMGWSFQTLNHDTLGVIKRKNPSDKRIKEIADKILAKQNTIPCELIAPMPAETKESYFKAQEFLIENGFSTQTYTTMLLYGTPLAADESRKKYRFKTKYRVIPRQFGEYRNKKVFEIEEVCVSTNTFSFKDYLDIRGFSLIARVFTTEQFDVIQRHLRDHNLSFFDYITETWKKVMQGKSELTELYNDFLNEIERELFNTEEELTAYFSNRENYSQLLNLTKGDNLIRKYTAKVYFLPWDKLLDFAYSVLREMKIYSRNQRESLNAAKEWAFTLRNVTNVFDKEKRNGPSKILHLPYDVLGWYNASGEKAPLHTYKTPTVYKISYGKKYTEVAKFLESFAKQRKGDNEFIFGNIIARAYKLSYLWLQCEKA